MVGTVTPSRRPGTPPELNSPHCTTRVPSPVSPRRASHLVIPSQQQSHLLNEAYKKRASIDVLPKRLDSLVLPIWYQRRSSCSMMLELSKTMGRSRSMTTLETVGKSKTGLTGRDRRRQHWLGRILEMRLDTEKMRNRFKHAGSNIRGGINTLFQKSSSNEDIHCEPQRNIIVDYLKPGQTREAYMGGFEDNDSSLDVPEKNLSSSLLLTQLRDGKFTSMIALDHLPVTNVRILVCGYRLEIFLDSRRSKLNRKHKICRPLKLGDIDIPIYVNPASLTFTIDEEEDALCIEGITKGYFPPDNQLGNKLTSKPFSMSSNDLHMLKNMQSPVITLKKKLQKVSMPVISRHNSAGNVKPNKESPSPVDNDNNGHKKLLRLRLNTR